MPCAEVLLYVAWVPYVSFRFLTLFVGDFVDGGDIGCVKFICMFVGGGFSRRYGACLGCGANRMWT